MAQTQAAVGAIWSNQARMQLSDAALQLASDELNRLAKQKQGLEKYLKELGPGAAGLEAYREQALFVENQVRWCLQGWPKAAPDVRKRLLRRTIKSIVAARAELLVTFWVSAEERDDATVVASGVGDAKTAGNIVTLRRPTRLTADHNPSIGSSGNVRNGSDGQT